MPVIIWSCKKQDVIEKKFENTKKFSRKKNVTKKKEFYLKRKMKVLIILINLLIAVVSDLKIEI